jgi:hypothetical protein
MTVPQIEGFARPGPFNEVAFFYQTNHGVAREIKHDT